MSLLRMRSVLAAGAVAGLACAAMAQDNVGYVDMNKVFEGYYRTAKEEAGLKAQEELYKQHFEGLGKGIEELKKKRDALAEEAVNVALSAEARAQKKDEATVADRLYVEKQGEFRKSYVEKRNELRQEYMRKRDALVKELLAQMQAFAKGKGYDTVMDVSGRTQNDLPVVMVYPKEREFTDAFLQEMNKGHEDEVLKRDAPATAGQP